MSLKNMLAFLLFALSVSIAPVTQAGEIVCTGSATDSPDGATIRIMTYNIRYDNPDDGVHAWSNRKDTLLSFLRSQTLDILCIQEGLHGQVMFLKTGQPNCSFRGVGRDDGIEKGEYSAIFFDTTKFSCTKSGTFWLAPHPDTPGKGWDAALPRIVTWVRLCETVSGKELFVFNTHFDHVGVEARVNSARIIKGRVQEIAGTYPVIVTGDFNSTEQDDPYRTIVARSEGLPGLVDAARRSESSPEGPSTTFTGFELKEPEPNNRIDFIFVSDSVHVAAHRTILARSRYGYLSDHLPVIVDFRLP
jgi:endonuclease/exonuclease/phosphatase family metal-dependent hydrolase